jgi:putative hemolysin
MEKSVQQIDIRELLKGRHIPHFLLNYLSRTVHQDEINLFLRGNGHLHGLAFLNAALDYMGSNYMLLGNRHIPDLGKYIFVANHPMGGLEGLLYFRIIGEKFPDVKSLSNDILMNVNNFNGLFVPIKVGGKQNREYVKQVDELYESESQILIFPAGLVSRRQSGIIRDVEWKKSFVSKAIQHNRAIVPAYISGKNSSFFYGLANLRKKLGIKTNLEMLYLPDEMFRQEIKTVRFTFGQTILPEMLHNGMHHHDWAQSIKSYVYALSENPDLDFLAFMKHKQN